MPESKNRGFSSAAGLIQYYDMEETKAVKIPPAVIISLGIAVSILVEILSWRLG
ncbi:MAG: preprotein translocase subunit Sec61beta [Thermoplasmata archaeon]|jgi:preprotein translocase subunit Sec61beta